MGQITGEIAIHEKFDFWLKIDRFRSKLYQNKRKSRHDIIYFRL